MILTNIYIEGFKSIDIQSIDFSPINKKSFFVLIGMNETGKSTILQAINLINHEQYDYKLFCNKEARYSNNEIYVEYSFKIREFRTVFSEMIQSIPEIPDLLLESIKLKDIVLIAKVNSSNKVNKEVFYNLVDSAAFTKYTIHDGRIQEYVRDMGQQSKSNEIITFLNTVFNKKINSVFFEKMPKVIFWEPKKEYLITGQVSLPVFQNNFNVSKPLYNIFRLNGFTDDEIKANLENIMQEPDVRYEFEERLSQNTTEYINAIWPEHKVSFEIKLDGNGVCNLFVKDKGTTNRFNMDNRSDGFKHFMSLLLSLSVEANNGSLENTIILLDEPEKSLHPGSIKYLRDELLNISKKNTVIASSHSPFIVDRKNLERHFVVTKEKGVTQVDRVDPEHPLEEEVIYESLGISLFDLLEPNIILFEGRSDKAIFDIFQNKILKTNPISKVLKTLVSGGGDKMSKLSTFFNNKFVKAYTILDNDRAGIKSKESISEIEPSLKDKVFLYSDLVENSLISSNELLLEDLIPENIVIEVMQNTLGIEVERKNIHNSVLNDIKRNYKISKEKEREFKINLCEYIAKDIKTLRIDETKEKYPLYCQFIERLYNEISNE